MAGSTSGAQRWVMAAVMAGAVLLGSVGAGVGLPVFATVVAGALTEEKVSGTLIYQLTSDLTPGEIVLGKLFARLAQVLVLFLTGLPMLCAVGVFVSAMRCSQRCTTEPTWRAVSPAQENSISPSMDRSAGAVQFAAGGSGARSTSSASRVSAVNGERGACMKSMASCSGTTRA